MAEMLLAFVIVGLSVAGLGLGVMRGGRAVRSCSQGHGACACEQARGKEAS